MNRKEVAMNEMTTGEVCVDCDCEVSVIVRGLEIEVSCDCGSVSVLAA
jgi:hypothetical protein